MIIRWDPKVQDEAMIAKHHLKTFHGGRTFDTYDHVDCFNYLNLHDTLKLIKHGYSKITDHVCREIRHGRLSRSEGELLVQHYEQRPPMYLELFQRWLGLSETGLRFLLDQHRSRNYWYKNDWNDWRFAGWSTHRNTNIISNISNVDLTEQRLGFISHMKYIDEKDAGYITV